MNCTAYTCYVTLLAKCTCAWLHHPLKLLHKHIILPCTNLSQPAVVINTS